MSSAVVQMPREDGPSRLIREKCREIIDGLATHDAIGSKDVASRVASALDRQHRSPTLIYFAAIEGIAQIARDELRGRHGFPDADDPQIDAFADRLNDRYPIRRLLEHMYPQLDERTRCELFQREPRTGWAGWGNETGAAA